MHTAKGNKTLICSNGTNKVLMKGRNMPLLDMKILG